MQRRTFFKLAGVSAAAAVGGAVVACSPRAESSPFLPQVSEEKPYRIAHESEINFTSEVDVLIIGSGIAGLSAAMAPAEAGRSVMVVEKQDLLGGESYISSGVMRVSGSAIQQDAGIDVTALEAWDARKQELANAGVSDLDFAKRLFLAAPDWVDHLNTAYKAQFANPSTHVKEGGLDTVLLPKNGLGDMGSIMVPLRDGLTAKGVMYSTGVNADAFILDEDDAICGMRLRVMKTYAISDVRARRVIMATGGFASSQMLMHLYVPAQERIGCYTFSSTGEGHILCAEMGGHLADMEKGGPLTSDLPEAAAWGLFGPVLIVDPYGNRFAREDDMNAAADACNRQGYGFWWTLFDKQLPESGQSRSVAQTTSKNVKRVVGPCDSLEDLAKELLVSEEVLKKTFEMYDAAVDNQKDEAFGRALFLRKLIPPFYAIKQFPVRYKTRGGTRTDGDGRLLSVAGSPVGKIYCCGSVGASSVEGLASNGAFGMLVGKAVAAALDKEDAEREAAQESESTKKK